MPSAKIFKMVRFQKEIHFWKAVVKRTFHFPFESPRVSFDFTNMELTIPEQPRISPFPSRSTVADRPSMSIG